MQNIHKSKQSHSASKVAEEDKEAMKAFRNNLKAIINYTPDRRSVEEKQKKL